MNRKLLFPLPPLSFLPPLSLPTLSPSSLPSYPTPSLPTLPPSPLPSYPTLPPSPLPSYPTPPPSLPTYLLLVTSQNSKLAESIVLFSSPIFPFLCLPSQAHPAGYSFCFFPGFLAIFMVCHRTNSKHTRKD